ncbi:MAG: 5-(carboxyamino)imidazole ribonucleotide synthase [Gammaproteobacteria bacterium]|nr:5-(carboxyamino)imidazole ribonucleotide synthase [Gammaproteobacteria bacterium]
MIPPGGVIGCLGGGQLGRMLGIEARRLGYGFHVFEPAAESPAAQVADSWTRAEYSDREALESFMDAVDVVTFEFENIPSEVLQQIADRCPVFPEWQVLHICQNREREKLFLREHGYPHANFAVIDSQQSLEQHMEEIGVPSVLKTADFGYDGKGQIKLNPGADATEIWQQFDYHRGVLEQWVEYERECSVVCARTQDGEISAFPVAENIHTNHILDFSIVPARMDAGLQQEAVKLAKSITEQLNVVGILGVELFVAKDGKLLVNELAPRTHNSGHYTIDACVTSQFEQQARIVAGLPLGDVTLRSPATMVNILGDAWQGGDPAWEVLLNQPETKLHLYGKSTPRVGRKMGHFTVLGETAEAAYQNAQTVKDSFNGKAK